MNTQTPREMYYETLANTIIKNLEKRQMEGFYCPTVEEAEKKITILLEKDGEVKEENFTAED